MSVDTIADFLTVMRNGIAVAKRSVTVPFSILKADIAQVLKSEGYIKDFKKITEDKKDFLLVDLKYVSGEAVIHEITRISKSGCRAYAPVHSLKPVTGGLGIAVLSTNKGVITDKRARELHVGGEVICHVW